MRLPIHFRLIIVSVLSVLTLVLAMFTSTGIASAHTQDAQRVNPRISIFTAFQFGRQCAALRVHGVNFTPSTRNRRNFAELFVFGIRQRGPGNAFNFRFGRFVQVNGIGQFTRQATVCGRFFHIRNVCARAEDERTGRLSNIACVRFFNQRPFGTL